MTTFDGATKGATSNTTPENEYARPPRDVQLPVAEVFHSLQGEGMWVGTPMHFIRLAGCSVGHGPNRTLKEPGLRVPFLKTNEPAWQCCTYDGRKFWCDTDFNLKERLSSDALLDETWEEHVCFTGGEPLVHRELLTPLLVECARRGIQVHIETSGTIMWLPSPPVWMSVSPKWTCWDAMLHRADEVKLLVDEHFDLAKIPYEVKRHKRVYVQPVNFEMSVDRDNVQRCMDILRLRPDWHLSVQTHKYLGLR